jgi:folate-dependent phosphoribosylglycinamide formyltransferase PurN
MRVVVFTGNAIRHKFVANTVTARADEALVLSECRKNDAADAAAFENSENPLEAHFYQRYATEKAEFAGNDAFRARCVPLLYKEANLRYAYDVVEAFKPDLAFVFGASLLREPLLSLIPAGRFINVHLGLSPYYRGSGTNFWPFVNDELQYVGSTILHIDPGVDTGDILCHVRPSIAPGDNVHTVGNKVIRESANVFVEILERVSRGEELPRVKQWECPDERVYRVADFNLEALQQYKRNLAGGMIERYCAAPPPPVRLIDL